jgi:hypothetical protein
LCANLRKKGIDMNVTPTPKLIKPLPSPREAGQRVCGNRVERDVNQPQIFQKLRQGIVGQKLNPHGTKT